LKRDILDLELIYRASRDGFAAKSFNSRCDNKGKTISIIKSEHNQIFGGYTDISFNSTVNNYIPGNGNTFVFSLSKNTMHECYRKEYEIYSHSSYLMCFGGHDMCIYD